MLTLRYYFFKHISVKRLVSLLGVKMSPFQLKGPGWMLEVVCQYNYCPSLQLMYMAWNLSNPANTPAPATPLRMLAPAPFIMDMKPSFFRIWIPQSMEPLYLTPPPEVIIMRLLMVSEGEV